jgi:hypothetical protein
MKQELITEDELMGQLREQGLETADGMQGLLGRRRTRQHYQNGGADQPAANPTGATRNNAMTVAIGVDAFHALAVFGPVIQLC